MQSVTGILILQTFLPSALFHVTWGLGKPSALHSTLASEPWANALSVGSSIQRGGTENVTFCYNKSQKTMFANGTFMIRKNIKVKL